MNFCKFENYRFSVYKRAEGKQSEAELGAKISIPLSLPARTALRDFASFDPSLSSTIHVSGKNVEKLSYEPSDLYSITYP
jgi:hypothetical protein